MKSFRWLDGLAALLRLGYTPSSSLPTAPAPTIDKSSTVNGGALVAPKATRPLTRPLTGSQPCLGGCGRPVSVNKRACLPCLKRFARLNLERRGLEVNEEEVERAMSAQLGLD